MRLNLLQKLRRTKVYAPNTYNRLPKRLNWEQIEAQPRQEGKNVVKGTSKRVVVVKSPDSRVFEQAIFIVREDFFSRNHDGSQNDILREAQAVADHYIRSTVLPAGRWPRLHLPLQVRIGGITAAAGMVIWACLHFFFGIL